MKNKNAYLAIATRIDSSLRVILKNPQVKKTLNKIRTAISNNEIELAFRELNDILGLMRSETIDDFVLLKAQWRKTQSDFRRGLIDYKTQNHANNSLLNSLLSIVNELQADEFIFNMLFDLEEALFQRMAYVKTKGLKVKGLWIDDVPVNNLYEVRLLNATGITFDIVLNSTTALELLAQNQYELIISGLGRQGNKNAGLTFLNQLVEKRLDVPFILYDLRLEGNRSLPDRAFGITDTPNELVHLVLDVRGRKSGQSHLKIRISFGTKRCPFLN